MFTNERLDDIDLRILETLKKEGRISNLELAERVGLSPTPCGRRVRKLESSGVITGYAAKVDAAALGLGVSVLVNIRLSRHSTAEHQEFRAAVERQPEITECMLIAGNIDYVLRVRVRDVEALREFIVNNLNRLPYVAETTTMLILERVKATEP